MMLSEAMSVNMSVTPSPEAVLAASDPGDEVGRRFRFQYLWAAIICCAILDETHEIIEVFCEHHEDILIKHSDGTFTGEQVKTREIDQPPWKAGDQAVVASFVRFVKLDVDYPQRFRAFRFASNHALYSAKNSQCVRHILAAVKQASSPADLSAPERRWISRLAKLAKVSEAGVLSTLRKCSATDELPKLQDATMRLVHALSSSWEKSSEHTHARVLKAAIRLADECGRASSLHHEQVLPAYLQAINDLKQEIIVRVEGKRLSIARILEVLEEGLVSTAILSGEPAKQVPPGQGSSELLYRKLDAGGFSSVSLNSAVNLRDKADYLALSWTKKHGREVGLERYDHVRSLALSEAARAFEDTTTPEDDFGPAMRENLRQRISARRAGGEQLFDCSDDHLEGVAYSLTAECQVQWSNARPWEEE
ncbi:dsDNA nuclease domain-containing protein [Pseudoxanthomonas sp. SE1]|uniref:dsDNA nuclease domain-containing protein n=1 Tax=Pseudoxanthomonas sp. SE1 TaxID=1664560 RepID=UPI00240E961A|nr:dsDNA nuclease domain-containing protein [Pseudoxanthomonas sp. SE1]WFC42281.1 dsDNA nuclease domain-containing protein [Pseudoxanthomonas sp. SE1]